MPDNSTQLGLGRVLRQSVSLFARKGLTFLALGFFPAAVLCAFGGALVSKMAPVKGNGDVYDPIAIWQSMSVLAKLAVFVIFFSSIALGIRSYAAAVHVTSEWRQGRSLGPFAAYARVRRKSLRLIWICSLGGFITGPLVTLSAPVLLLFLGPGIPVAVLEGKGVREALRGGFDLVKESWGRLIVAFVLFVAAAIASVVVWLAAMSVLPSKPLLVRLTISALFLATLLLPVEWFLSVLTLAYFDLKERAGSG